MLNSAVEAVEFVYRSSPVSTQINIEASDAGKVVLLKNKSPKFCPITNIWIFNTVRSVRIRQKLPIWDEIIPYSPHGDERSAVVCQGSGLSFITFEGKGTREIHSIPTDWVTYNFLKVEDCRRFQKELYGRDLCLTVPVKEIYTGHGIRLTGYENVRIWEESLCSGFSRMHFMVPLMQQKGWKSHLEFDLGQAKAQGKRKDKLRLQPTNAVLAEDVGLLHHRQSSTTSLSSASSGSSSIVSIFRRLSGNNSYSPFLVDDITIVFPSETDLDRLLKAALNCRSDLQAKPEPSGLPNG
ncbi:hypothetical protein GJ744_004073 [Endocarpon pusillum]|uniref:Uncharacterized protein n=1 Tax=Endocarpon pusillum TaxID=364733 RepID=A0A8H7DZD0_9EURO|nr:hypothetical protein GJ744_004073 [Endocarpon pusillum]